MAFDPSTAKPIGAFDPSTAKPVGRFDPSTAKPALSSTPTPQPPAPDQLVPSYDPMGTPTGYYEPAPSEPTMPYRQQMAELAKATGRFGKGVVPGIVGGIAGMPGDIGALTGMGTQLVQKGTGLSPEVAGLVAYGPLYPFTRLAQKLPTSHKVEETLFGKPASTAEAAGRTAGELISPIPGSLAAKGAKAAAAGIKARMPASAAEQLAEQVASTRGLVGEMAGEAGETLAQRAAKARSGTYAGRVALREQEAAAQKVLSETTEAETLSRQQAGLPAPVTVQDIQAGRDVGSVLRAEGVRANVAAQETQREGGAAFQQYIEAAKAASSAEPFSASAPGRELLIWLDKRIKGGGGEIRSVSGQEMRDLRVIRDELFGKPRANAKDIDIEVVEREIRRLRSVAERGERLGFNAVQQEEASTAASKIENALNQWLRQYGAERPREAYRQASIARNNFETRLGEALAGREEVPFAVDDRGMFKTAQSALANLIYKSKDSVRWARELMNPEVVNQQGIQHAMNELEGKTSKEVIKWLKENEYHTEIPGLTERLQQYATALERREVSTQVAQAATERVAKGREAISQTEARRAKELESIKSTVDNLRIKMVDAKPETLINEWAKEGGLRKQLESTGLYTTQQLDELAAQLRRISEISDKVERSQKFKELADNVVRWPIRKIGWKTGVGGAAGIGLYEWLRK